MSADNSIALSGREPNAHAERAGFEVPPDVAYWYNVRIFDAPSGERRLGLFVPQARDNPAIEITEDRIIARDEGLGTIQDLVKIAQHNGWDRFGVDGSPEFRRVM